MGKNESASSASTGIISYGAYVPFWRLDRNKIASTSAAKGFRRVASFDEDTTTMGVAAARLALKSLNNPDAQPGIEASNIEALWFSTAEPAYLEKTNATAIHSALRLDPHTSALDFGGASRSGIGALKNAFLTRGASPDSSASKLVVLSGLRFGLPGSVDESMGGDGAATFLIGDEAEAQKSGNPLIAEYVEGTSITQEFIDRWRLPGDNSTHQWEERFGEYAYEALVEKALASLGTDLGSLDQLAILGTHSRAVRNATKKVSTQVDQSNLADDLSAQVGIAGCAHPGLVLARMLEGAKPNQSLGLMWIADGVETLILRTTEAIKNFQATQTLEEQLNEGGDISYMDYLRWRGMLKFQPPNRPEPPRISAPAALRSGEWKYGFVGSRGDETATLHLPPARVSIKPGDVYDEMLPAPMADAQATIVTFTIDRLVYSESPPVIFAIVDFEGGGRFPVELTDADPDEIAIGMKVEMVFRKLYTTGGIHNYFYKARPVRKLKND